MKQSKNYFTLSLKEIINIESFDKNRVLVASHVRELARALKKDCSKFIQAMIVFKTPDGTLKFIDGHHRQAACSLIFQKDPNAKDDQGNSIELDVLVYNIKDMAEAYELVEKLNNTQLRWNPMDFIKFNAHRGNRNCSNFLNFYDKYESNEIIASSIGKCFAVLGHYKPKKSDKESMDKFPIISDYHIEDGTKFMEFYNNLISAMNGIMIYIIGPNNLGVLWNFRRAFFEGIIDESFIDRVAATKLSEYDLRRGIRYSCAKNTEGYYRETVEGFISLINRKQINEND